MVAARGAGHGCVVIGSDTPTVSEFVTHEQNGLLVPFFDPKGLADTVLRVLEDAPLARRLREGARRYAEQNLAMGDYIAAYEALIGKLTGKRYLRPYPLAAPWPKSHIRAGPTRPLSA